MQKNPHFHLKGGHHEWRPTWKGLFRYLLINRIYFNVEDVTRFTSVRRLSITYWYIFRGYPGLPLIELWTDDTNKGFIQCYQSFVFFLTRAVFIIQCRIITGRSNYHHKTRLAQRTRAIFSFNQEGIRPKQSWFVSTSFRALRFVYMYLLRVLIGLLDCLLFCDWLEW